MITEIIFMCAGLILSAFFSGSEIAMITAHPLQLQKWKAQKKPFAASALRMYEDRQHYLTMVLVGNTLANVLTTTFATILFTSIGLFNWWQTILVVAGTILLFGEVLPKSLIRHRPNSYLIFSSAVIRVLGVILHPVARFFEKMISGLLKLFKSDQAPVSLMIRREEIEQSIFDSYEMGVLNEEKKRYIDNVFEFSDTVASEIITPRTDIVALSEDAGLPEMKRTFIRSGFSKIIMYRDNIDFITGYISLRDILNAPAQLKTIIRPIRFYPESKSIIELLKEFQRTKTSIAVIVDEFGGTSGIVTMEDIVEEIFGEFDDEFDENAPEVRRHANGDMVMSGRTEIDQLNEEYKLTLPEGEYETVAGYLLDHLDRFPQEGEVVSIGHLEFTILKATPKSIDYIKLRQVPAVK
ncbi:MAG: HlyC/CorC family transporter [Candidatus Marinimicrobia bacterium]|nr:HlyC/CorC family transporter [Candidatus Neomarinimicrobiota bacterium]